MSMLTVCRKPRMTLHCTMVPRLLQAKSSRADGIARLPSLDVINLARCRMIHALLWCSASLASQESRGAGKFAW
ncbi:hypothetical protein DQ04_10301020 [Trypanosoma grayi]|uniref:hypothetical protein n=1 Tax=Trypanosoma grayi TaxID=71804 RepID=UPI0004F45F95|nr:hypothetical protein DQ04_10301020 [Trypanosoma grayi]KEG07284.1 hypothetical protein DQ04_10301020 [Trypanosoma grayi]